VKVFCQKKQWDSIHRSRSRQRSDSLHGHGKHKTVAVLYMFSTPNRRFDHLVGCARENPAEMRSGVCRDSQEFELGKFLVVKFQMVQMIKKSYTRGKNLLQS